MPDPFAPEGILPNVLRWVDRPGQAVRNVLRGDTGAASRQFLDFLTEPIDAAIPFVDLIPEATKQEDYISGSELAGVEGDYAKPLADIVFGAATDPLTYLSFGAVPALKGAAGATKYGVGVGIPFTGGKATKMYGAFNAPVDPLSLITRGADTGITKALTKADELTQSKSVAGAQPSRYVKGYEDFKAWARRATGSEKLSPEVRQRMSEAAAEGSMASKYWTQEASKAVGGLDAEERVLLTLANMGVDIGTLKPGKQINAPLQVLGNDFQANVATLAGTYGKDAAKLQKAAAAVSDIGQRQYDEAFGKQAMFKSPGQNQDYLQRQWILEGQDDAFGGGARAKATEKRTLTTPEDVSRFLSGGDVGVELDAAKLLLNRATQQGRMLTQAKLAKEYAPGSSSALEEGLRTEAIAGIKSSGLHRDEVAALENMMNGMPPRGPILGTLAKLTRPVKGAMVYGVVLPKIGSLVRNKLGMGLQAAATPGVREEAFTHLNPVNVLQEMGKAADHAYGTTIFGKADDLSQDIAEIEKAYATARSTDDVLKNLTHKPELQAAVRNGVLDGFVSTEEILSKIGRDPAFAKFWDIYQAPGVMFQYLEQRGRLQTFKNLLAKNKDPAKSAAMTKEALYDYGVNSPENRALRDVVPFAQFMVKSVPQQAKWLSERPAVAAASAPLFYDASGDEPPVYPWMQGRSRIGVGTDEAGSPTYLTGFGLPMESLNVIPDFSGSLSTFGRGVQQGMLASTAPVLKTAAAITTGEDPFFGTPYGSYDKIPLVGNAGDLGRAYNMVAGTGFLEPIGAGMLRQAGALTDESKPLGARAVDFATGAKLVSVDPDVAEQRTITSYLETRPDIKQYRTFYQTDPDDEFSALMAQLREAKARVKEKREQAAAAGL